MPAWEVNQWKFFLMKEDREREGGGTSEPEMAQIDAGQRELDEMLRTGKMGPEDYEDACERLRKKRELWAEAVK